MPELEGGRGGEEGGRGQVMMASLAPGLSGRRMDGPREWDLQER